jgi:outer membrane protein TolC
MVMQYNPDLKSIMSRMEAAQAGRQIATKSTLPSFTLGLDYIETGPAIDTDLPESGKDAWMVTVGVSLPIWFGKNSARKREAQAQLKSAAYDYEDARNRLTVMIEQALFDHADALRKVKLYRDGLVPKAEQSLNASYTAYQAGETDFLNLLDTQRQLLNFQLVLERSWADLVVARAGIQMLTGEEL